MKHVLLKTICAAVVWGVAAVHAETAGKICSEGSDWPSHLQGVCTDGTSLWWSHASQLAKTDLDGKLLCKNASVPYHHGDLCIAEGTLYVAVNLGQFNTEDKADSWVYAYDPDTLEFKTRWRVPELRHGAGGMTFKDGHFFVIGGLPPTHDENYVYEYEKDFRFVRRYVLASGWTNLGIQTANWDGKRFLFGCYGGKRPTDGKRVPSYTLVCPPDLSSCELVAEDTAVAVLNLSGKTWRACMKRMNPGEKKAKYSVWIEPAPKFN